MSSKRTTRADVAKRAGVSTATVSYVLNRTNKVHPDTRARVLDAAAELNYTPDPIARSLVTKQTMQTSIVLNDIANPIYSELILGFEQNALDHGYFVNICTGASKLDEYFRTFINRRIDGVLIEALPDKFDMEKVYELVRANIRVVMFGHEGADLRQISSIETDYIDLMDRAVDHLSSLGHRRIAYLSGLTRRQRFDRRIEGFERAVAAHGLKDEAFVWAPSLRSGTKINDGIRGMTEVLRAGRNFTAIITTNDLMAIGAMRTLREAGLRVPDEISIMGIDNAPLSEFIEPPLTTMAIPYFEIGRKAFDLLYADLSDGVTGFLQIHGELLKRSSTAAVSNRCSGVGRSP